MHLQEAIEKLKKSSVWRAAIAAAKLEQRTEKQWKECEDGGYNRESARQETKLSKWIFYAFFWPMSPEKNDFWQTIYEDLCREDLCREEEEKSKITITSDIKMVMTKTPPTKPGYYWWQQRKKTKRYLVRVYSDKYTGKLYADDGLIAPEECFRYKSSYHEWSPISEAPGYWSNIPIETPKGYK